MTSPALCVTYDRPYGATPITFPTTPKPRTPSRVSDYSSLEDWTVIYDAIKSDY